MSSDSFGFSGTALADNDDDFDEAENFSGLQLKASNEEECDILSSLLQDSILHVHSHSFHEDRKCLRLVLNRFCWELLQDQDNDGAADARNEGGSEEEHQKENPAAADSLIKHPQSSRYFRVHSGLYIHNIDEVVINDNFKKIKDERYLNMLAFHACGNEISLLFAGHKNMYLKISKIDVHLKDLNQRYMTAICPQRAL